MLAGLPAGYRAIVVDNGSSDGSAAVAAAHGATVVAEPRRGFGAAAPPVSRRPRHPGLRSATPTARWIRRTAARSSRRSPPGPPTSCSGGGVPTAFSAWPPHARIANAGLARRLTRRTGGRLHDLGPMRAARRADLLALGVRDRRSGYPLRRVLAAAARWRSPRCDVAYAPRTGRSKVTGTVRGTAHAIADMRRALAEVPA